MISRTRIKWIKSLEMRKYRLQEKAFVAEGPKLVGELLPYSTPLYIAATKDWLWVTLPLAVCFFPEIRSVTFPLSGRVVSASEYAS